ncbi:MAG: D-glycero-beta-D-manno-heptose 1-phosphate adenylyltransferase [Ignavibacteriaceae bacterium]
MNEIKSRDEIKIIRQKLIKENKRVVFTNGCFDILHSGHVDYLTKAKSLGDILVVGLNSDKSIREIKGEKRPIVNENNRAIILAALKPVDYIVLFDEETPADLIDDIIPDILVKGADWDIDKIVGKDTVLNNGGEVKTIKFVNDQSTSKIIDTIISRYK